MNKPPGILYPLDWRATIAALALGLSLFNLWYSTFRRGKLTFTCSRWTAIGLDTSGKVGAAFAVKVDVMNTGTKPIELNDLLLKAKTHNGKTVFYDPLLLFDLTGYIGSMGQQRRMAMAQKGMAPLPLSVPAERQYEFGFEILFMPHDKATAVKSATDAPFELRLYALSSRDKDYRLVAEQHFVPEDISKLTNGSFAGVLSMSSISRRQQFIQKRTASQKARGPQEPL